MQSVRASSEDAMAVVVLTGCSTVVSCRRCSNVGWVLSILQRPTNILQTMIIIIMIAFDCMANLKHRKPHGTELRINTWLIQKLVKLRVFNLGHWYLDLCTPYTPEIFTLCLKSWMLCNVIPEIFFGVYDHLKTTDTYASCELAFQVVASGLDGGNCRNIIYGSTVLKLRNPHYRIAHDFNEQWSTLAVLLW